VVAWRRRRGRAPEGGGGGGRAADGVGGGAARKCRIFSREDLSRAPPSSSIDASSRRTRTDVPRPTSTHGVYVCAGDPLMRGANGRPRAQDYFQLTSFKSTRVDVNAGWALPADHDPDFVPTVRLQAKKHDKLREWQTKLGPVSMDTYRPLI
jgi:hypothetical protein